MSAERGPRGPSPGASPARNGRWLADRLGLDELRKALGGFTGPGRRQPVAHVRLRRRRRCSCWRRCTGIAAGDGLRAVGDGRVGVGRVHPGPAHARLVRARAPQLRLVGADRRRRRAPAAGAAVRRLPAPARAELDGRPRAVRRWWRCSRSRATCCPWDQKGYWAKLVEATIAGSTPVVGDPAQQLIQGGGAFGNLTLTRAYALHAMALARRC